MQTLFIHFLKSKFEFKKSITLSHELLFIITLKIIFLFLLFFITISFLINSKDLKSGHNIKAPGVIFSKNSKSLIISFFVFSLSAK